MNSAEKLSRLGEVTEEVSGVDFSVGEEARLAAVEKIVTSKARRMVSMQSQRVSATSERK